MKIGLRTPSLRRRIAARTSWKRYVRHSLGLKAPRGWGWLTNPRRAAYNRVYYRTSFSIDRLLAPRRRRRRASASGCLVAVGYIGLAIVILAAIGQTVFRSARRFH